MRFIFKCGVAPRGVGNLIYHPQSGIVGIGISGRAGNGLYLCSLAGGGRRKVGSVVFAVEISPVIHREGILKRIGFRGVVPAVILEGVGADTLHGDGLEVVGLSSVGVPGMGERGMGHRIGVSCPGYIDIAEPDGVGITFHLCRGGRFLVLVSTGRVQDIIREGYHGPVAENNMVQSCGLGLSPVDKSVKEGSIRTTAGGNNRIFKVVLVVSQTSRVDGRSRREGGAVQPLAVILERGPPSAWGFDSGQMPGSDNVKDYPFSALGQIHARELGISGKDIPVTVRGDYCKFIKLGKLVREVADGHRVYLETIPVGVERRVVEDDISMESQMEFPAVTGNGKMKDVRLCIHLSLVVVGGSGARHPDDLWRTSARTVVKKVEHEPPPL